MGNTIEVPGHFTIELTNENDIKIHTYNRCISTIYWDNNYIIDKKVCGKYTIDLLVDYPRFYIIYDNKKICFINNNIHSYKYYHNDIYTKTYFSDKNIIYNNYHNIMVAQLKNLFSEFNYYIKDNMKFLHGISRIYEKNYKLVSNYYNDKLIECNVTYYTNFIWNNRKNYIDIIITHGK